MSFLFQWQAVPHSHPHGTLFNSMTPSVHVSKISLAHASKLHAAAKSSPPNTRRYPFWPCFGSHRALGRAQLSLS